MSVIYCLESANDEEAEAISGQYAHRAAAMRPLSEVEPATMN